MIFFMHSPHDIRLMHLSRGYPRPFSGRWCEQKFGGNRGECEALCMVKCRGPTEIVDTCVNSSSVSSKHGSSLTMFSLGTVLEEIVDFKTRECRTACPRSNAQSRSRDYLIGSPLTLVLSPRNAHAPLHAQTLRVAPTALCAVCVAGNVWKSRSQGRLWRSITREKAAGLLFTVCDHTTQEHVMFTIFAGKVYDVTEFLDGI